MTNPHLQFSTEGTLFFKVNAKDIPDYSIAKDAPKRVAHIAIVYEQLALGFIPLSVFPTLFLIFLATLFILLYLEPMMREFILKM